MTGIEDENDRIFYYNEYVVEEVIVVVKLDTSAEYNFKEPWPLAS